MMRFNPILLACCVCLFFAGGLSSRSQSAQDTRTKPQPEVKNKMCDGCCEGCKPDHAPMQVTIRCHDDRAEASPARLVAETLNPFHKNIQWVSAVSVRSWTVAFDAKSPCQRKRFDRKNSTCQVQGSAGEYRYRMTLDGCANSGDGKLIVK